MAVLYDIKRGGDEVGSGGSVGTNKKAVYNELAEMWGAFKTRSDGERVGNVFGTFRRRRTLISRFYGTRGESGGRVRLCDRRKRFGTARRR